MQRLVINLADVEITEHLGILDRNGSVSRE